MLCLSNTLQAKLKYKFLGQIKRTNHGTVETSFYGYAIQLSTSQSNARIAS